MKQAPHQPFNCCHDHSLKKESGYDVEKTHNRSDCPNRNWATH